MQSIDPAKRTALPGPSHLREVEGLAREYNSAYSLVTGGKYLQALETYRRALAHASAAGNKRMAGRCLTSIGSCQFALFQYRASLSSYLEARPLAESTQDWANLGSLNSNIAGLFLQMGDLESAAHSADQALAGFERMEFPGGRSRCLIQLGIIRARQGRMKEAAVVFGQAVDNSYRENDLSAVAQAWDHLGEGYLSQEELSQAETALSEAFRVRKLHHLTQLDSSYLNLARLRLAQGDIRSAANLVVEAEAGQSRPGTLVTAWELYHTRGRVNMAGGRTEVAYADFHKALNLARRWRLEVLPADFTRISSEGELEHIYSSFVEAANQLYLGSWRRQELARESFRATEENRAASLQALLREPNGWRDKLPGEYWETLARLHGIESAMLHTDDAALRDRMVQLRSTLLLLEAKAGSNADLASDALLERTQESLPSDAAMFSFHLGERQSFLWAVSHDRFRLYRLPGKSLLTADITQFEDAVRNGSGSAMLGEDLYRKLFGQLDTSFRSKPQWILALDEQLFHLPFGALVLGTVEGGPVYLAQRHSIRITTGAAILAAKRQKSWSEILSGTFLGVGDPIYNTADPRWNKPPVERTSFFPGVAYAAGASFQRRGPVLARLAGSAREVESCAHAWDERPGQALLLEGPDASPAALSQALHTSPSAVHIAAHFIQVTTVPRYSLIALSLSGTGESQLMSPLDITRAKFNAGVVVLSGCSSGRADALPASGLMGLTRAWLAGGARAVVASHWPTPDDSGSLFIYFYKHLRETPDAGPAVALQGAQRDIVRAGGWRSNPQFWATYFVVGDQ